MESAWGNWEVSLTKATKFSLRLLEELSKGKIESTVKQSKAYGEAITSQLYRCYINIISVLKDDCSVNLYSAVYRDTFKLNSLTRRLCSSFFSSRWQKNLHA